MNGPGSGAGGRLAEFGRFLEIQNLGLNLGFALAFLFVAADGLPTLRTTALVVVAFVAARNAGHAFNRYADRALDAANPRTQGRALVTGRYTPRFALLVVIGSAAVVVAAGALLNPLALALAPVALAIVLGYSYTKRVTAWTTVYLGLVESITPAAAYVAVTGTLPRIAGIAVAAVLCIGTAFETIHSLGDLATDRASGLRSLPLALGAERSRRLVPVLHGAAVVLLLLYVRAAGLHVGATIGVLVGAAVLGFIDVGLLTARASARTLFQAHFAVGAAFLGGVVVALFVFP